MKLEEHLVPDLVRLVVTQDTAEVPLVSLESAGGEHLAILGSQWQTDLRAVLATGVDIAAELTDPSTFSLRRGDD